MTSLGIFGNSGLFVLVNNSQSSKKTDTRRSPKIIEKVFGRQFMPTQSYASQFVKVFYSFASCELNVEDITAKSLCEFSK